LLQIAENDRSERSKLSWIQILGIRSSKRVATRREKSPGEVCEWTYLATALGFLHGTD